MAIGQRRVGRGFLRDEAQGACKQHLSFQSPHCVTIEVKCGSTPGPFLSVLARWCFLGTVPVEHFVLHTARVADISVT